MNWRGKASGKLYCGAFELCAGCVVAWDIEMEEQKVRCLIIVWYYTLSDMHAAYLGPFAGIASLPHLIFPALQLLSAI